jgi:hypothetical protein
MAKLNGLGQVPFSPGPDDTDTLVNTCGSNPCWPTDYVYLSKSCQDYLGCADPTNSLYVGATKGLLNAAGAAVGSAAGQTVAGIGQGLGIPAPVWYLALGAVILLALKK